MNETKNLFDIIQESIKEVGLTPFTCTKEKEKTCQDRDIGKFPEKYLGQRHCFHQIPYVKPIKSVWDKNVYKIEIIDLCEYTLTEYWKK